MQPRLKIHEIDPDYHCSIIGTCLTMKESRRAAAAELGSLCKGGCDKKMSDYAVHSFVVQNAKKAGALSKHLTKQLNRKYALILKRFDLSLPDAQLRKLFESSLKSGEAAGAWWALLSHPSRSRETVYYAFGEIHMLSHLNGFSNRVNLKEREGLKTKIILLEEEKNELRRALNTVERERQEFFEERDTALCQAVTLNEERAELVKQITRLENGDELRQARAENERLRSLMGKSERKNRGLAVHCEVLEVKLAQQAETLDSADDTKSCLPESPAREESALFPVSVAEKLKGKKVLYLGGRPGSRNRCCRELESLGAELCFHDGGREMSLKQLPGRVRAADFVFCPADCVSHAAIAKRECRSCGAQFHFLKSGGRSSLARELENAL